MAQDYYTILTNAGLAYEAACKANQVPIKLTHFAVGDGNGAAYNPGPDATALRRETHRQPINSLLQDEANPSWLMAEALVADDVGGWTIREVGIYTDTGILYAIGKYPDSVKPILAQGSGKQFYVRAIFQTSNASSVTLLVDNSVVMATRAFVLEHVQAELAKLDSKQSVRVATTGNIALTGLQTIDGVVLAAGDRVLVKSQAAAKDNGIYIAALDVWPRAADADINAEVTPGLVMHIEQGATLADSRWQLVTDAPIVLGTTALTFQDVTAGYAPIASPAFTGAPTAPTPVAADKSLNLATTEFVRRAIGDTTGSIAIPSVSVIDSATDFDAIIQPGWFSSLLGGAAGSRNPNHPDGQAAAGNGSGVANYYWLLVAKYSSNLIQVALPYASSADTTIATIKFRLLGGATWSPWRSLAHSENLKEATQAEAEAAAITGKWLSPLRALQLIRAAAANATEALRGVLRVGTQVEVDAGTLDDVAVTPKKLFNGALIVSSTYMAIKLPSWLGGWIFQRGSVSVAVEGGAHSVSVTLPLAYTTSYSLNATFWYTGSRVENGNIAQPRDKTLTGFTLDNQWVGSGSNLAGTIDFTTFGK